MKQKSAKLCNWITEIPEYEIMSKLNIKRYNYHETSSFQNVVVIVTNLSKMQYKITDIFAS